MWCSGGCNIEGEDESWDFGTGAGFYVDATQEPWKTNYCMYSYVTEEVCRSHDNSSRADGSIYYCESIDTAMRC